MRSIDESALVSCMSLSSAMAAALLWRLLQKIHPSTPAKMQWSFVQDQRLDIAYSDH